MEEGESLLLMFLGFHSFCYDTIPFFPKKRIRSSIKAACLQTIFLGMFHDSRMKNGGANIVLPGSRSRCVKGGLEDRGQRTGH